jgi:two-component system LytT family response regulator
MKALIIEDEILASRHLRQVLDEVGGFTVLQVVESIRETVSWFEKYQQPDIVFMDIHLSDGSAFEIFKLTKITCPIIFTTSYDEYALKAFKVNSIDYLLKPIEVNDVQDALKKLREISDKGNMQNTINSLISTFSKGSKYKKHFLIPVKGDKLIPVQTDDLACFFVDSGIIKGLTFEGRSFAMDFTLDELTDFLDPEFFFRANRQYIISRKAIKDIDLWFNSRLSVNLNVSVPDKIVISRGRIPEFKTWFAGQQNSN